MTEIGITMPLEIGGAQTIRAAGRLSLETRGDRGPFLTGGRVGLWLQVTGSGEERALYYHRVEASDFHAQAWPALPYLPVAVADAVNEAVADSVRLEELETEPVYSWESADFDPSATYDTRACSLELQPDSMPSAEDDARLLQGLDVYDEALNHAGFRRIRNWLQRGPQGRVFVTVYNEALDLRAALRTWRTSDVAIDHWTRNRVRTMSHEDAELWEGLLSVEPVLVLSDPTKDPR